MKFHENPSSGSRVFECRRADRRAFRQTDRQTDMTKLTVAIRNFANSLKNGGTGTLRVVGIVIQKTRV